MRCGLTESFWHSYCLPTHTLLQARALTQFLSGWFAPDPVAGRWDVFSLTHSELECGGLGLLQGFRWLCTPTKHPVAGWGLQLHAPYTAPHLEAKFSDVRHFWNRDSGIFLLETNWSMVRHYSPRGSVPWLEFSGPHWLGFQERGKPEWISSHSCDTLGEDGGQMKSWEEPLSWVLG